MDNIYVVLIKEKHTSLAIAVDALAAWTEIASLRKSYPFFFASSLASLYSF